jgi:hypothetical protein
MQTILGAPRFTGGPDHHADHYRRDRTAPGRQKLCRSNDSRWRSLRSMSERMCGLGSECPTPTTFGWGVTPYLSLSGCQRLRSPTVPCSLETAFQPNYRFMRAYIIGSTRAGSAKQTSQIVDEARRYLRDHSRLFLQRFLDGDFYISSEGSTRTFIFRPACSASNPSLITSSILTVVTHPVVS